MVRLVVGCGKVDLRKTAGLEGEIISPLQELELGASRAPKTLVATTQPRTQNNLKQLLLGWY